MSKKILSDFVVESQIRSQTSHGTQGLRVLARLIAREIVNKQQDSTSRKSGGEMNEPRALENC